MMMPSHAAPLALVTCFAMGLASAAHAAPPLDGARLEALLREADVPGLALGTVVNGKPGRVYYAGLADVEHGRRVGPDTVFEAASLSKPVVAYAVLQLVDQGKLALDTPLGRYLPKPYLDGDARLDAITARMVLSHRTGFPNWRPKGRPLAIAFQPGDHFSYSGEGFVYLQRAVEQVTHEPLHRVVQELVLTPLGMSDSSLVWRPDYDARAALRYDAEGAPSASPHQQEANAAYSLETSVRDYARFVAAIMRGARLKPATWRAMLTPAVAVDPTCTNCTDHAPKERSTTLFWGLGWGLERDGRDGGSERFWHWGDNGGMRAFVMADRRRQSAVVFFTNGENGLGLAPELVGATLGGTHPAFSWLTYDRYDAPGPRFRRAVRDQGVDAALAAFAAPLRDGSIPEGAVNRIGYGLLAKKRVADAVRLFELNAELHPQSGNVFDSLGEAQAAAGDKTRAIASYQRALELDPKNDNAAAMLERLGAKAK